MVDWVGDTTRKSRSVQPDSASAAHLPVLAASVAVVSAAASIEAASGVAGSEEAEATVDSEADEAASAMEEGQTATQTALQQALAADTEAEALASMTEVHAAMPISNLSHRGADTTTVTATILAMAVDADRSGRMKAAVGITMRIAVGDVTRRNVTVARFR